MSGRWRSSDVQAQLLATGAGVVVGAVAGEIVGEPWPGVTFFGGIIVANGLLKFLRPSNTVLNETSWGMFVFGAVVLLTSVYLFSNPILPGGWTIIVVFGLFFVYGLVSLVVSARRTGDANHRGAGDDGAG